MKLYRLAALLLAALMLMALAACTPDAPDVSDTADTADIPDAPADTAGEGDAAEPQEEQRYVEVNREGTADRIPVEIAEGMALDYTMAYDPEFFVFQPGEDVDTFAYDSWPGEQRVYYCVCRNTDFTAQELVDGLILQNSDNYDEYTTEELTLGENAATGVYFTSYSVDAYPMHFFVIETADGCCVIEAQFSMEMYEGLYQIMYACFETLELGA